MGLNKFFLFLLLILTSILKSKILFAGTVSFSNFDSKIEIQLSGSPIKGGFVSVGTTEASVFNDRQSLYQSFIQFGNSTTISGASAFNLDGGVGPAGAPPSTPRIVSLTFLMIPSFL